MSSTSEDPTAGVRLGWWLSSEEHDPRALVQHTVIAEQAGLTTAMISDHLQPWVPTQGNSPHVWTTIGAIAQATDAIEVGTGVSAMVGRNSPITIAQAAATAAVLLEGRFFLGVGTGERLNEQPFGDRWPSVSERRQHMCEAIEIVRALLRGDQVDHRGERWTVQSLQLATRPAQPPPIYVASSGKQTAKAAGEVGDGMIAVTPDNELVDGFRGSGGEGKPCLAQVHISLAATVDEARENAWRWWPHGVVPPALLGELSRPKEFEAAAIAIGPQAISETVVCTSDSAAIIAAIDEFVGAGFGHVYIHQIGSDQQRLADACAAELLPHYRNGR